jgi:FAD/FMN-containing dehydrogenase
LDPAGFSPAVMQSNNDFGVASTYSVNAHGWPVPFGPFGSTVRSLDMMIADGSIVTCTREQNSELFRLAMGGYGLFGVILRLEVDMVPNMLLRPRYDRMPSGEFASKFTSAATDTRIVMAYGRLSVAKDDFFDEALMVTFSPEENKGPLPTAVDHGSFTFLSKRIYRAQVGSELGKHARWAAETVLNPRLSTGPSTRNSLMNEPVANLASDDNSRTDILHEYFVPASRFKDFVALCQKLIPSSGQELLNITLRYVAADHDSVLAYAPEARIAGVMSFAQVISPESEESMIRLTEAMIDGIAGLGGAFYLPYRLHARRDQVLRIYPRAAEFAERKRHHDPGLIFRNALWSAYFANET